MKNIFPRMHVSLYVSDLHNTISFYNKFFGTKPVKVKPMYAKYILEQPSLIISFVENKERVQQNFGHLGFQVETSEELNRRMESAQNENIISKIETGTACCYALQDKFWAKDPDGVQWEVYYFHEDAEFNDPHYESENSEACCMPVPETEKETNSSCCVPNEKRKVGLSSPGQKNSCC